MKFHYGSIGLPTAPEAWLAILNHNNQTCELIPCLAKGVAYKSSIGPVRFVSHTKQALIETNDGLLYLAKMNSVELSANGVHDYRIRVFELIEDAIEWSRVSGTRGELLPKGVCFRQTMTE